MMKNSFIIVLLAVIIGFIVGGSIFYCNEPEVIKTDTVFSIHTDTFYKDTTIYEKQIVPKIIEKVKVDTFYKENGDTVQLVTESKVFEKRLVSGKDTVDAEIYTTGINTSLDSLKIRLKTHHEVITNTIEITKIVEKKKTFWDRFHFGIQTGLGYGLTKKEFDVYAGVGGSFDL